MDGNPQTQCCRLIQALYGLKTSPKDWNKELSGTLNDLGFVRIHSDWNFFFKITPNGSKIFIAFHVDDGLLTSNDGVALQEVVDQLGRKYKIKVNQNPNLFLGISVVRNREARLLGLCQSSYIRQCAEKI